MVGATGPQQWLSAMEYLTTTRDSFTEMEAASRVEDSPCPSPPVLNPVYVPLLSSPQDLDGHKGREKGTLHLDNDGLPWAEF